MRVINILTILFAWMLVSVSYGYETDQYSVPPQSLADIGEDLSRFIHENLRLGIQEINHDRVTLPQRIRNLEEDLSHYPPALFDDPVAEHPGKHEYQTKKNELQQMRLRYTALQSPLGIIGLLHEKYSGRITWSEQRDGVFGISLGYLPYENNLKNDKLILFNHSKFGTIYSLAGFHRVISPSYFVFASTIKVYGVMMGVDKFGHFINQGYQYLEEYKKGLASLKDSSAAYKNMIQWGVDSEDGVFGSLVDGVYSNADLAANFAGFIFYQNFFKEMKIGSEVYPAILEFKDNGDLQMSQSEFNTPANLLKRFMTHHLDESLNPSVLEYLQRYPVRKAIEKRCDSWKKYYGIYAKGELNKLTTPLKTWFGYPYGHKSENALRLQDICFSH